MATLTVGCGLFPDLDHLSGSKASAEAGPTLPRTASRPASPTRQCGLSEVYVKAQAPHRSAFFGGRLAADGDTMVVVAPLEKNPWDDERANPDPAQTCDNGQSIVNPEISGSGVLRSYERNGTGWREQQLVMSSRPGAERAIVEPSLVPALYNKATIPAYDVAISGDWIAVGTAGDATRGEFRGSVRVFQRRGGSWAEAPYVVENERAADGDLFGSAVALSGNLLVVGAPGEEVRGSSGMATDAGAVHVYQLTDVAPLPLEPLTAGFVDEKALFGTAVALSPDWLAVGAPLEDDAVDSPGADPHADSRDDTGAIYVYARDRDVLRDPIRIVGTSHTGLFGVSLAISGSELAAGAPTAALQGIVQLYTLGVADASAEATLVPNDPQAFLFGFSVAMTSGAVIVGAPFAGGRADAGASEAPSVLIPYYQSTGSTYLFRRSGGGSWDEEPCRLKASNADPCDNFGISVAASDDYLAIGAPLEDGLSMGVGGDAASNDLLDTGAVYVYTTQGR